MSEDGKAIPQVRFDAAPGEIATEKETSESYTNSEAGLTHIRELEREEKRLLFKLDRIIVPLTALLYLSAYLDRSVTLFVIRQRRLLISNRGNIGNARLQGLQSELLDGSGTKYNIVLAGK